MCCAYVLSFPTVVADERAVADWAGSLEHKGYAIAAPLATQVILRAQSPAPAHSVNEAKLRSELSQPSPAIATAAAAAVRPEASSTQSQPPLQCLVVDDSRINCRVVCMMLKKIGHVPTFVLSGEEALAKCEQQWFDLVLMDMQMPNGLDGEQTVRRIREKEAEWYAQYPEKRRQGVWLYVTALTASATLSGVCHQAGMQGFLLKPLDKERLNQEIAACVEWHSQDDQAGKGEESIVLDVSTPLSAT